ncbi:hypothetical protein [Mucilaginibacter phyllosphaerae]|uniref:Uncharacterized protein n=1 Tax=Mucilaginibacter phyllosphaerae TaxID=1812349 RepID=A0A4Y8AD96_9SPHI|nr:hypothetical protein [Mucilaginibacter phyllosphaerae]MBB3969297.1 hypothetical protein [Mucilaginibacter phyllosphaerae]TEW65906.1 hypothetical protein E2R65_12290 [Mucilaginibacter phyllosphaerae]GGH07515.1 hypothetical protein GCM10007352_12320 [Mucilaginibacter phyllosphaerae]
MKKTLYYKEQFGRKNSYKEFFLNASYSFASIARLPLEIFTRKNFGERYFSFPHIIVFTVVMALFPIGYIKAQQFAFGGFDAGTMITKFTTWYIFLAAVFKVSLQRREEVKRLPNVFDFERFSLSTGILNPRIRQFPINGKIQDIRTVETLIEPCLFFIVGLGLSILFQPIGYLIVVCSIFYSLSYVAAYNIGDHYIMDLIDNMICAEELADVFVDDKSQDSARGFRTYGRKPVDPDLRRKVADAMFEDDEPVYAV